MSTIVKSYRHWIANESNFAMVKQIEDMARMMSLLLPVSYKDSSNANILSESAFVFVNTIGLLNDHIHAYASRKSKNTKTMFVNKLSTSLNIIGSLAVIGEMIAKSRWGERGRWKLILTIELLRAMLRFCILKNSNWRTLEYGGAKIIETLNSDEHEVSGPSWWKGRNGTLLPVPREITLCNSCTGPNAPFGTLQIISETTNITRPVAFVFLRVLLGKQSWVPILASLACTLVCDQVSRWAQMDVVNTCRRAGLRGPAAKISLSIQQEMSRRRLAIFLLLMREPLFTRLTRHVLERGCDMLSFIPIVRVLLRFALDMAIYFQRYYFYSSG